MAPPDKTILPPRTAPASPVVIVPSFPVIASADPARLPAESAGQTTGESADPETPAPAAPVYGGLSAPSNPPFCNSQPISTPTFVRFFKICISLTILLFGAYFTIRNVYPVLRELAKPGSTNAAKGADAPLGVKVLQQTRSVVAKNDANVANLNAIINGEFPQDNVPLPTLPAPPVAPKPAAKPEARLNLDAMTNAIDALKINGVVGGKKPRIIVDGVLLGIGSVVDHSLGLKFVGLDESKHVIYLANNQETIFPRSY